MHIYYTHSHTFIGRANAENMLNLRRGTFPQRRARHAKKHAFNGGGGVGAVYVLPKIHSHTQRAQKYPRKYRRINVSVKCKCRFLIAYTHIRHDTTLSRARRDGGWSVSEFRSSCCGCQTPSEREKGNERQWKGKACNPAIR